MNCKMGKILFPETLIQQCVIHRVGNKNNDEGVVLSDNATTLSPELKVTLIKYFLQSFEGKEEAWNFMHINDVKFNEVSSYASDLFGGADLVDVSKNIAKQLYECSIHPNIKGGELFVVKLSNVYYDRKFVDAIGLFKSEVRETVLTVKMEKNRLVLSSEIGMSLKKLEKGCIVFNVDKENGWTVLTDDGSMAAHFEHTVAITDDGCEVLTLPADYP